jgi:hypothetical protein
MEGHMKKVAIAIIGILVALYLAAYGPWRTGGQKGGSNVAQEGSQPATGAQNVNQSVKDSQQPVKEGKQRVTNAQGAKRHYNGVKRSMAGMRRNAEQRAEGIEVQVIVTPVVEQWTIDVGRPTEDVEVISVESEGKVVEPSGEPVYVEYMGGSSDWTPARRVDIAVPEPQECPTPYGWVEYSDP